MTNKYHEQSEAQGGVSQQDIDDLTSSFIDCHNALVDEDDKALLMVAFEKSKSLIESYGKEAQAAVLEAKLLKGKNVQMKMAVSEIKRAAKKFTEVSG